MATSFEREAKMKTTEPSVNESKIKPGRELAADTKVKMKRGGKAKMADGGMYAPAIAARMAAARPRGAAMMPAGRMGRPAMPMVKEGGKMEKSSEHKAEMKEMHKIEKELKHHEGMKAGKAHHGLKRGGKVDQPGGLLGGIEAYGAHSKGKTGGIEGPGYKRGGKIMQKAMGGKIQRNTVDQEAHTKVVEAKQRKSISSKTGGVEGVGYKKGGKAHYAAGGSVKKYENTLVHGGPKMPTKPLGTGEIKQSPAGYKHGGHVAMKHSDHGHVAMKKGGCF
jgi:hypothetical protein